MKMKKRNIVTNLIWSIKELCQFSPLYLGMMLFEALLNGVAPIISLLLTQEMINKVQVQTETVRAVLTLLVILSIFELLNELVTKLISLKLNSYEMKFDVFLQKKILKKIAVLDSKDFENSRTYDLINRTQYDVNAGILENIQTFFSLVSLIISVMSYVAIIVSYSKWIVCVILLVPIIRYWFEKKYNLLEYDIIKENTEPERKASYLSFLMTNSEYFKEIKMFRLFDFLIKKFETLKATCNLRIIRLYNRRTRTECVLGLAETILDFLVTASIVIRAFQGTILIGQFVLYNNSITSFKQNMLSAFSQVSSLYKNSSMIDQIRTFFELPVEELNPDGKLIDEIQSIRLENVSYRYGRKEEYALRNISFTLHRGEFTVFMGLNGSGKSTLMKIIMGIYHDYEGEIFINDINLKHVNQEHYRKKIGTLFQDYIKYENSISENIWYGNLEYWNDSQKLDDLLKKVELETFTDRKEQALGYQFNEGRQLSIGQWQKLALARTLIKDADVYIFDEPNSALDLISENAILQSIYAQTKEKITLMIMHRFHQVVVKSDKIIVLKNGSVEAIGTHEQLLKDKGTYYELYSIQNERVDHSPLVRKKRIAENEGD